MRNWIIFLDERRAIAIAERSLHIEAAGGFVSCA